MTIQTIHKLQLDVIACATCAMEFGVPSRFIERLRTNGENFYCPKGHSNWFGKSEADKLKEKLATEKRNAEFWRSRSDNERNRADTAERSRAAIKGQLTKVKKRVGNGVCPCCNRSFENLHRHMETKHPEFKKGEVSE